MHNLHTFAVIVEPTKFTYLMKAKDTGNAIEEQDFETLALKKQKGKKKVTQDVDGCGGLKRHTGTYKGPFLPYFCFFVNDFDSSFLKWGSHFHDDHN